MPFRLVNSSVIFQRHITQILRSVLEKRILIYLNNILIVSLSEEENRKKVEQVKKLLTETEL